LSKTLPNWKMGLKLKSREFIGFAGRGRIFWCLILNDPIHL
jgi:hypothetical protein